MINYLVLSQLAREDFMAVTALSPVLLTVRCVDTQTDYVPVKQDGRVTTVRTVTFFGKSVPWLSYFGLIFRITYTFCQDINCLD